jgi:stress-induced morphogen
LQFFFNIVSYLNAYFYFINIFSFYYCILFYFYFIFFFSYCQQTFQCSVLVRRHKFTEHGKGDGAGMANKEKSKSTTNKGKSKSKTKQASNRKQDASVAASTSLDTSFSDRSGVCESSGDGDNDADAAFECGEDDGEMSGGNLTPLGAKQVDVKQEFMSASGKKVVRKVGERKDDKIKGGESVSGALAVGITRDNVQEEGEDEDSDLETLEKLDVSLLVKFPKPKQMESCICEVCGKHLVNRGAVERHKRQTHQDLRPHSCQQCPKTFKRAYSLKRHILQCHTRARPEMCQYCGLSFGNADQLKRHHGGYQPADYLTCQVCSESFQCVTNLRRHKKTHGKMKRKFHSLPIKTRKDKGVKKKKPSEDGEGDGDGGGSGAKKKKKGKKAENVEVETGPLPEDITMAMDIYKRRVEQNLQGYSSALFDMQQQLAYRAAEDQSMKYEGLVEKEVII